MDSKIFCRFSDIKIIFVVFFLALMPLSLSAGQLDDSDGDGLPDIYEKQIGTEAFLFDTDGDGLSDGVEVGDDREHPLNTDKDRYINALDFDDDNDGLPTVLEGKNDTDHDGIPDYLDTDSDNDKISDGVEAGMLGKDQNTDLIDDAFDSEQIGAIDKNGDGVNDLFKMPDFDNDGIPDYLDKTYNKFSGKNKSSKIQLTKKPVKNKKTAKQTLVAKKTDNESKKLVEIKAEKEKAIVSNTPVKNKESDTNKKTVVLHEDKKVNKVTIQKNKEKKKQDNLVKVKKSQKDKKAVASLEASIKEKNQKILQKLRKEKLALELALKKKSHEKNLLRENKRLAKEAKNKYKSKVIKSPNVVLVKKHKTDDKKSANLYVDTDNDGLLDSLERILGTDPNNRDTDGDKVSDAIEIGMDINDPQDSDHDSIIDALDPDDDNDGVLTKNEDANNDSSPINDDTDEDGVPNYLDANDDGDDRLTIEEGSTKDTDHDGILDYLDKDDGVKVSDNLANKKHAKSKKPEVIVLFDGNLDSLNHSEDDDLTKEAIKKVSLDKPDKKKEEKGVISWITSLLPD